MADLSDLSNEQLDRLYKIFASLDDWTDRYRHLLEMAKKLEPLDEHERSDENKVTGCLSQVWLVADPERAEDDDDVIVFRADSDAQLVRGLIAVLLLIYSGHPAADVVKTDAKEIFARLGLDDHLSVGRRNGVESMIQRIKTLAQDRLDA